MQLSTAPPTVNLDLQLASAKGMRKAREAAHWVFLQPDRVGSGPGWYLVGLVLPAVLGKPARVAVEHDTVWLKL